MNTEIKQKLREKVTFNTKIQQKPTQIFSFVHMNRELQQKLLTYKKDADVFLTRVQIAENTHTQTRSKHQKDTKKLLKK